MALIACADCGKQVSTAASACPACGCPVPDEYRQQRQKAAIMERAAGNGKEPVLLKVRSSLWNFTWQVALFLVLMPLAVIYVPGEWWNRLWVLPVAWVVYLLIHSLYYRRSFVLRIYPERVTVEEGFLSKELSEFFIRDIRSIDVKQSFWARIVNIGDLTISTAASAEASEEAPGVPGPRRIRDLLITLREQSTNE